MEWTKKIGSVAGIPIRIHLTMLILAAWLLLVGKGGAGEQFRELTGLIILFGSVALHELGHALTAKYLGIRTRDITLYPFGGIASLIDKINPRQELLITLAGPLVNVFIASAVYIFVGPDRILQEDFMDSALGNLFSVNAGLAIFNALPAFPMDGGRILRASLQLLGVRSATKIAARCGQAICILLAIVALYFSHPILLLIAVFVFSNASRELVMNDVANNSQSLTATEVMVPFESMQRLSPSTTLENAARIALRSLQTHFPICLESRVLGVTDRDTIIQKACNASEAKYITEIMRRDIPLCTPETGLSEINLSFEQLQTPAIIVGTADECHGIVFRQQLNDLLLLNEVFRQNQAQREIEQEFGGP